MADQSGQSMLVGRLHADQELARQAGFALFVQTYAQQRGWLPEGLGLEAAVTAVLEQNEHLLAYFRDAERKRRLGELDAGATVELTGWLRAQHLEQEEPQVAYELAVLALGVELPAILVRGLRELALEPGSTVAELPDGSGYAAVFLSTLHPHWQAVGHTTLFVAGVDAEQLAGWAMLLLSGRLQAPMGSIERVGEKDAAARAAMARHAADVALVYNPVRWLSQPYSQAMQATRYVLL